MEGRWREQGYLNGRKVERARLPKWKEGGESTGRGSEMVENWNAGFVVCVAYFAHRRVHVLVTYCTALL